MSMVAVTQAVQETGTTKSGRFSTSWWMLETECRHIVRRPVKFIPGASGGRRGWALLHHPPASDDSLPPPTKVKCPMCNGDG
jgi:hypothetical protein